MKSISVRRGDLNTLLKELEINTKKTVARLSTLINEQHPRSVFRTLRFEEFGADPLDGKPWNFVEQLNQTFTVLASFMAAEHAFETMDVESIELNLGPNKGHDAIFMNRLGDEIGIAEVFASVNPKNNDKLRKDVEKVRQSTHQHRRVYFVSSMLDEFKLEGLSSEAGELLLPDGILVKHLRDGLNGY